MPVADELGDPTDSSDLKCYDDMFYYCKHLLKLTIIKHLWYLYSVYFILDLISVKQFIIMIGGWAMFFIGETIQFCTNEFKSKYDYASTNYPVYDWCNA